MIFQFYDFLGIQKKVESRVVYIGKIYRWDLLSLFVNCWLNLGIQLSMYIINRVDQVYFQLYGKLENVLWQRFF